MIMTPHETHEAQAPAVEEHVAKINAVLATGMRWFVVPTGIGPEIRRCLRIRGWKVTKDQENDNGWLLLRVEEAEHGVTPETS